MHRHELSDPQYAHLEPFLPEPRHHGKAGRPWLPHRTVVNGILWILRTGAPWRDLPAHAPIQLKAIMLYFLPPAAALCCAILFWAMVRSSREILSSSRWLVRTRK